MKEAYSVFYFISRVGHPFIRPFPELLYGSANENYVLFKDMSLVSCIKLGGNMKTTLLIMAAGIGSRFGMGIKLQEPVDDGNHIIMDYSIHDTIESGFNHIVFIIRKDIEKEFKEVIVDRIASICSNHNVTVDYALFERWMLIFLITTVVSYIIVMMARTVVGDIKKLRWIGLD